VALGIKFAQIIPLFPYRVFMQWDLIDPTESGSYTFTIERSGSSAGPWELLQAGLQNNYNHIDDFRDQPDHPVDGKINLFSLQRQVYYRVTVVPPSGCINQAQTDPQGLYRVSAGPLADGLRRRLQHDEAIIFQRLNGVRLAVLKRRRWGERCTMCYDVLTKTVTKEHCPECYGTSFKLGYWDPVVTFGRIYPPNNVMPQTTSKDKKEASQHLITLLDVPMVQDQDLIVEIDTNERHRVESQKQTELRRKSVHQQVTTSLIDRGSVEYELMVDTREVPPLL